MTSRPRISDELRTVLDQFHAIDWTFEDAKTNRGLHSIHPYPARFVPHIPRHLLRLFHPVVDGPVFDPFCGSGTTLVECQAKGITSFGVDVNPIAALISRVKTNPPRQEIGSLASKLVAMAKNSTRDPSPDIPRLDHWFTPGASRALAKLTRLMTDLADSGIDDAIRVALSRIIVRVSRQDSDTRYAAVDRSVEETDVYRLFVDSSRTLDSIFQKEHSDMFRQWAPSGVLNKDILTVEPHELPYKFGLVITSPPYPNAYEYWLYHKYRMYWLGEDPILVREAEIGARPHYFRRNPATPDDFRKQMSRCFGLFRMVTLPSALVCMVIGRSIIRGQSIDNVQLLRSAATENGFYNLASTTRQIPTARKSFNPAHGTIREETILVFSRQESCKE